MSIFTYREIKGNRGRIRFRWHLIASVLLLIAMALLGIWSAYSYPKVIQGVMQLAFSW